MVVDARHVAKHVPGHVAGHVAGYVAGSGVLIGSGARWLLLTDPHDDSVVEELFRTLGENADDSPRDRILAIVERVFAARPFDLALIDLSGDVSDDVARGGGDVRRIGGDAVLLIGGAAGEVPGRGDGRPLVGGVVAAAAAYVSATPSETAAGAAAVADPPPGLIDGIPAAILAARGPDGPPPPRPRLPRESRESTAPYEDTGALRDTTEPDAELVRIEHGGHTTIRPARTVGSVESVGSGPDDHDGATVHRPAHLLSTRPVTVLAVRCPVGHLSPASEPSCRSCRQRVAPQEPRTVPRPPLGGLRLPSGEVVPLDRGVVLGRKPASAETGDDWPHLVHLPSDYSFVSRVHLRIELHGWDVVARDLGSRGGTTLVAGAGRAPERMRPHEGYAIEPGARLDLAEVYEVRFETGPLDER